MVAIIRTIYFLAGPRFLRGTWVQTTVLSLSFITIFMGSMLAYMEKHLKKRIAYSSVSQTQTHSQQAQDAGIIVDDQDMGGRSVLRIHLVRRDVDLLLRGRDCSVFSISAMALSFSCSFSFCCWLSLSCWASFSFCASVFARSWYCAESS